MNPEIFVQGALSSSMDEKGYVSFHRFFPEQLEAVQSNAMWNAMTDSAAGVVLRFRTNGSRISLRCRPHNVLKLFLPVAKQVKPADKKQAKENMMRMFGGGGTNHHARVDGIDFLLDGRLVKSERPRRTTLHFSFSNPQHRLREVEIVLPLILGCGFSHLRSNGSLEPAAKRPQILCLGDSITQGFVAGWPSKCYVARLGDALDADVLNQGIGGHIFQPESLNGMEKLPFCPACITVAYGTNDWHDCQSIQELQANISAYFARLHALFPGVPVYIISPLWRADCDDKRPHGAPLTHVRQLLLSEQEKYDHMTVIDGYTLIDHDTLLFEDGFLHPNRQGFAQMTDRLLQAIRTATLQASNRKQNQ